MEKIKLEDAYANVYNMCERIQLDGPSRRGLDQCLMIIGQKLNVLSPEGQIKVSEPQEPKQANRADRRAKKGK